MPLHLVIFFLVIIIATTIAVVSWRRRTAPGANSLIIFAFALAAAIIPYTLFWETFPQFRLLWLAATYLGLTAAPAAILAFAIEYSNRARWLSGPNRILLVIEPIFTQLLLWSNYQHELFFSTKGQDVIEINLVNGPWVAINTIYSDALILIAIFLLFQTFKHGPLAYRIQSGAILVGTIAPILFDNVRLASFIAIPSLDLTLIAFTITGLAFSYGLFYYRLLDIVPIARDLVVEKMSDGWVVLDKQNRIVDLNPAAEEIIGVFRNKIFGRPAESILSNFPNVMRGVDDARELDIKGSVNTAAGWKYLNLRISPVLGRNENLLGQLVVWRDITDRRMADEARQRARDEMFILLHSISGAASRAVDLDDFLTEAIYQIVYSFRSQSIVVFLLENMNSSMENRRLVLTAHHGLPDSGASAMAFLPGDAEMITWVLENREPLLIPDVSTDSRAPASMQQLGNSSLILVPMIAEEHMLGIIGLIRKDGLPYSSDEIARLSAVADEVATFVHSNRQRQLSIALAERKRLVRDLHDSVTQKLYGLIALTEAAQAGLEAGSMDMPGQVLSRIGDNARQALKEMRLFLHELQPIDLEREGLVAILHQRLAAVEGRADTKARLLADEDIYLSLDKEVALYFITQEALNNVLRHAGAKSVTVRLKQKRVNVILEVDDDGCGFDPTKEHKGGMGLKNIRERSLQIGAKLNIVSVPGAGTKICVSVRSDRPSKPYQNRR
jgi:PAS domain S-box-containing protein